MTKNRRVAVYARLSVDRKDKGTGKSDSVSIDRQIERCTAHAEAQGWTVVGTFTDIVSGSVRPESRPGWQAMLESQPDAVVAWKLDRIGRLRITRFWDTYQRLEAAGIGLVSVTENLDGDSTIGRAFMGLLMSFAEMEREAISARVTDARRYLLNNGRVAGGKVPWPWMTVPNPEGKGRVLVQNPDTIDLLRLAVERTVAGRTIYSTVDALREAGVEVSYSGLERLLRNPLCAGMIPYSPGNSTKERGDGVVRGDDGLPVVYPDLAVMPVGRWRAMVKALDDRSSAQSKPVALRAKTSGALSGLLYCGDPRHPEPVRMWRGTTQGRHGVYCPDCHHTATNIEPTIIDEFLHQKGDQTMWIAGGVAEEGGAAEAAEILVRIQELQDEQTAAYDRDDGKAAAALGVQIDAARAMRKSALARPAVYRDAFAESGLFRDAWEAAGDDDEARRDVLGRAIERIVVSRGRTGRPSRESVLARLDIAWLRPTELGQRPEPSQEDLARWASEDPVPRRVT